MRKKFVCCQNCFDKDASILFSLRCRTLLDQDYVTGVNLEFAPLGLY